MNAELYTQTNRIGTEAPVYPVTTTTKHDLTPVLLMKVQSIQGMSLGRPLIALCDSGSTGTMINTAALPYGAIPDQASYRQFTTTANGSFDSSRSVWLDGIQLPEFVNGRHIKGVIASLFNSPGCRYDIILGRDFLKAIDKVQS